MRIHSVRSILFSRLRAVHGARRKIFFHDRSAGIFEGLIAVLIFAVTMPTMKVAVKELDPVLVGVGRLVVAALPSALTLLLLKAPRPSARQFGSLAVVVLCLVFGFSWILAEALRHVSSHHAAIVAGSIPLVVALVAVVREGERPSLLFWLAALAGAFVVIGYGLRGSGWRLAWADGLPLIGAVACGIGYAEGARVGKEIGSLAASCWVPILAVPFALLLCADHLPADWRTVSSEAWMALAYNGVFSCWFGFVFWYRGLAAGGTARVGQLQLLQPFFTLVLVALCFHETIGMRDWVAAAAVFVCVAAAQASSRRPAMDDTETPAGGRMPMAQPASTAVIDR